MMQEKTMSSKKANCLRLAFGIIFLFAYAGVGHADSETIDLTYRTAGIEPATCSKSVAIITFQDNRTESGIGESGKGKKFQSSPPVSEWITRALYDELKSVGCRVEYHDTAGEFGTDVIMTGAVEQAYIKQDSWTKYNVNMRLQIFITVGNKKITKTYRSTMTKRTAPAFSFNSNVATESLQDVMREAVPALQSILE